MNKIIISIILYFLTLINSNIGENRLNSHVEEVIQYTQEYSEEYGIPEELMKSIFYFESKFFEENDNYNAYVVGDDGRSLGVGQVQLPTAKFVWKNDTTVEVSKNKLRYDIKFNIQTAFKYVYYLQNRLKNKYTTEKSLWLAVLTSYNAGEGYLIKNKKFNGYAYKVYDRYIHLLNNKKEIELTNN